MILLVAPLVVFAASTLADAVVCPVNRTKFPPVSCPAGTECCPTQWGPNVCGDIHCNTCAECCHDYLQNSTDCNACVHSKCTDPSTYSNFGCRRPGGPCCTAGVPDAPSTTLPNVLLVGDSVTNGLFSQAAEMLSDVAKVQHIENVDAYNENICFWSLRNYAVNATPIEWDLIHYNEGLHSLWPRVNTSEEMATWAEQLKNFTKTLQASAPHLIYATMTPYMPEKFLNPPGEPQNDVETKNALAVKTVQGCGVQAINDLYTVVTNHCGAVYKSCDICDNESQYHPGIECGFHYNTDGWKMLATAVNNAVRKGLKALGSDL